MNIGSIKQNESGVYIGSISTLAVTLTLALRPVQSPNPKAPKYEIMALSAARKWVQVGALFEFTANNETRRVFLSGTIEDPSLAAPLYISAFMQEDDSYNIVWNRPNRRRDLAAEMAPKSDDGLPPLPGDEGEASGQEAQRADTGLGQSSSEHPFGTEQASGSRGKRNQRVSEEPKEPADATA